MHSPRCRCDCAAFMPFHARSLDGIVGGKKIEERAESQSDRWGEFIITHQYPSPSPSPSPSSDTHRPSTADVHFLFLSPRYGVYNASRGILDCTLSRLAKSPLHTFRLINPLIISKLFPSGCRSTYSTLALPAPAPYDRFTLSSPPKSPRSYSGVRPEPDPPQRRRPWSGVMLWTRRRVCGSVVVRVTSCPLRRIGLSACCDNDFD
jgi:hypothetical protein